MSSTIESQSLSPAQGASSKTAHLIACHECDLLIDIGHFQPAAREKMCCPRCKHILSRGHERPLETVIALSLTAMIMLFLSCLYPFISFFAQGQSRTISLLQTSSELYLYGFPILALLVFSFIVLLPFLYLASLLFLLVPIQWSTSFSKKKSEQKKRKPPIFLGRLISYLLPWSMADVFLIGVLIALIKIVGMAEVGLGVSFWAYVIFVPFFIYLSNLVDAHRLWHWVEHGK